MPTMSFQLTRVHSLPQHDSVLPLHDFEPKVELHETEVAHLKQTMHLLLEHIDVYRLRTSDDQVVNLGAHHHA